MVPIRAKPRCNAPPIGPTCDRVPRPNVPPLPPSAAPEVRLDGVFPSSFHDPIEQKCLGLIETIREQAVLVFEGLEARQIPRDDIVFAVFDPKDALGRCFILRTAVEARCRRDAEANLKKGYETLLSWMPLACARRIFYDEPTILAFFERAVPEGTTRMLAVAAGGGLALFLPMAGSSAKTL